MKGRSKLTTLHGKVVSFGPPPFAVCGSGKPIVQCCLPPDNSGPDVTINLHGVVSLVLALLPLAGVGVMSQLH